MAQENTAAIVGPALATGGTAGPLPARSAAFAAAFKELDDAIGDVPKRFFRHARTLADKCECREEWDRVERAHDALRAHETLP